MSTKTIHTFCFSPTGTSQKITAAVALGAQEGNTIVHHNLTHTATAPLTLTSNDAAIFAVPVYGGHVPPVALKRLEQVQGDATPAILIAVYGNRAFENTLNELSEFVSRKGFVPVAAGAFIGEHSYSTEDFPIAVERPDARDIARAEEMGRNVARLLSADSFTPIDVSSLHDTPAPKASLEKFVAFIMEYRKQQSEQPVVLLPATDENLCAGCGACVDVCPTEAIDHDDVFHTDPARCIRCCACVKVCRTGARRFETPFSKALSENFGLRKEPTTTFDK